MSRFSAVNTEHLIYSIGVIHYWVFGHPVAVPQCHYEWRLM